MKTINLILKKVDWGLIRISTLGSLCVGAFIMMIVCFFI